MAGQHGRQFELIGELIVIFTAFICIACVADGIWCSGTSHKDYVVASIHGVGFDETLGLPKLRRRIRRSLADWPVEN